MNFLRAWDKLKRSEFIDGFGLIVTKEINNIPGDGGDTPQREGMLALSARLDAPKHMHHQFQKRLKQVWKYTRKSKGQYRRHPDPESWTSNTNVFSRDQSLSLIVALGAWGMKKELKEFFYAHLRRFGFYWNTRRNGQWPTLAEHTAKAPHWKDWDYSWKIPDFAFVHHWGVYIRAFDNKWFAPLLIITDLGLLLDSIIRVIKGYRNPDYALDDNYITMMIQAQLRLPTPIIKLCRYIFKFRPQAGRHKRPLNPHWNSAQASMYWEFRGHYPPMGEFYHDICGRYFD